MLRNEAGLLVDRLLIRVARGRGALDIAIGEGLASLAERDRALRLGFSGIGDYARERLGIAGRTAQVMAQLARELRARPLLAAAVRSGQVSARKATAILAVARGADEAQWVERARAETVRALEVAAREERGRRTGMGNATRNAMMVLAAAADGEAAAGPDPETAIGTLTATTTTRATATTDTSATETPTTTTTTTLTPTTRATATTTATITSTDNTPKTDAETAPVTDDTADTDDPWERVYIRVEPAGRARVDEALDLAGKLLGATSPKWQRVETLCQEYLGAHPVPDGCEEELISARVPEWLPRVKELLEKEMDSWRFLDRCHAIHLADHGTEPWTGITGEAAPGPTSSNPGKLDAELRRLVALRDRWDEVLGHLALLLKMLGLWRDMKFATFGQYCAERLGMAESTVAQRIALERKLYGLPALREAMREGRISYEKARVVARHANADTEAALIARAEADTCIALRRELDDERDAEARKRAPEDLHLAMPSRVAGLLRSACGAAQEVAKHKTGLWTPPGECLVRVADHFIDTWKEVLRERSTPQKRALARDKGFCQVPGCSRAAVHAHHLTFRSAGGTDEPENLVSLCAAHHLHGIHAGYLRVTGLAPDRLTWAVP